MDFFFQAEDGIRDLYVTGVQTCALPIYKGCRLQLQIGGLGDLVGDLHDGLGSRDLLLDLLGGHAFVRKALELRSEERRVGKECRSRWSTSHYRQNRYIN